MNRVRIMLSAIIAAMVVFGVAAYYMTSKNAANVPDPEVADWRVYSDTEHGFEMKYSPDWNLDGDTFSFLTNNGYAATFSTEDTIPAPKNLTVEDLREKYDAMGRNPQARKVSDMLKEVSVGDEAGLELAGFGCEQGNPCYARYEFYSNSMLKNGFKFYVSIPYLRDGDVNYSTFDSIFFDDILVVRKALSTLRFTR